MILRVSGKLGKKIGGHPTKSLPLHDNPYLDWSGHLFQVQRVQHIMLTNTASLYSLLFLGRGITSQEEYVDCVRRELRTFLEQAGYASIHAKHIAPHDGPVLFSKALNRSVIGSMNNMILIATTHLERHGMTLREAAHYINRMPMFSLDEYYPYKAFTDLEVS